MFLVGSIKSKKKMKNLRAKDGNDSNEDHRPLFLLLAGGRICMVSRGLLWDRLSVFGCLQTRRYKNELKQEFKMMICRMRGSSGDLGHVASSRKVPRETDTERQEKRKVKRGKHVYERSMWYSGSQPRRVHAILDNECNSKKREIACKTFLNE